MERTLLSRTRSCAATATPNRRTSAGPAFSGDCSDCAQAQLSAWEAIRREGQTLPGAILALQNTLITADQTAILGEVPQTETPIWPHTRLSWEDPRDLADAITASDVAPGLPSDLL